MEIITIFLSFLADAINFIFENAGAIATLAGVAMALYGLNRWKREYCFKHNSELLEEALVLFYEAEIAIDYMRNGFVFANELEDFVFLPELEENYILHRYKNTHVMQKRFEEKQDIFNKLKSIKLRVRARFGEEMIASFDSITTKVKELLISGDQYSVKGITREVLADIEKIIWKERSRLSEEGDTFGNAIIEIVQNFEKLCRDKMR